MSYTGSNKKWAVIAAMDARLTLTPNSLILYFWPGLEL